MSSSNIFDQGFSGKRWLSRAHLVDLANAADVATTVQEGDEGRRKMYKEAWAKLLHTVFTKLQEIYKHNPPQSQQDDDIFDEIFYGGQFYNNKRLRVQMSRAIRTNVYDIVSCLFRRIRDAKRKTGNGLVWQYKGELHSDFCDLVQLLGFLEDKEITLRSGSKRTLRVEPIVEKMRAAVKKIKDKTPELEPPPREQVETTETSAATETNASEQVETAQTEE